MKKVAILGSTGSIGVQALDVVRRNREQLEVTALTAGSNAQKLCEQFHEFRPRFIAIRDESQYNLVASECDCWTGQGQEACEFIASLPEIDLVLVAVSGAAGIGPTLEAVRHGKIVALANKESLVAAGDIITETARTSGARIIPVDSEHSAVFQCLRDERKWVHCIWLTASGGPFRALDPLSLEKVTPEMALKHPNWLMGQKITIDSATMMNKGLEVIEAHHLFGLDYEQIRVVIHPESVIHSLVEFSDGSLLGHMGVPDMRIPIQYAFSYPQRWREPCPRLHLDELKALHFERPDYQKFPAFELALQAGKRGGTMPAVMNAANEIAVNAFLKGKLSFNGIPALVEKVMSRHVCSDDRSIGTIMDCDTWARETSRQIIEGMI
jgi:1-deoxy-D-xylulose-5-phosphate reductoisomerase